MFEDFKKLVGVKKIMSFGGWSFSTSADTAPIFREGVTPTERLTFANNVVKFASDNNLDGLDFDWEYPGMSFFTSLRHYAQQQNEANEDLTPV
jgi:chitinase